MRMRYLGHPQSIAQWGVLCPAFACAFILRTTNLPTLPIRVSQFQISELILTENAMTLSTHCSNPSLIIQLFTFAQENRLMVVGDMVENKRGTTVLVLGVGCKINYLPETRCRV